MRATISTIDAATSTVTGRPERPQMIVPAMNTMRATSSGSRTQRDQSPRTIFCHVRPGAATGTCGALVSDTLNLHSCRRSSNGVSCRAVRRSPHRHLEPDDDEANGGVETCSADDAREPMALSPGKHDSPAEQGSYAHHQRQ